MDDLVPPRQADITYETDEPVRYEVDGAVAHIIMNRPGFNNAQNSQMTYALDDAFRRAVDDDAVRAIVLRGEGKHFSAGHDIGTPGRDVAKSWERKHLVPDHVNKPAAEFLYTREQEVYIGMCRRWRDVPKPTIAAIQGACIAGGLMLAWVCDLIVATEDAFFQDPVNRMGIPGVEYFAHGFELPPRIAKEFILLGERMPAERAYNFGMVNRLSARETLLADVKKIADELASRPRLGNWLTKQALNHVEDLRGKRTAMDAAFHMHHFAHAQNDLTSSNSLGGQDARSMAAANKAAEADRAAAKDKGSKDS
ncbi:enoyl-CoA hydratase [Novosphingobium aquimarinum]|uniref:enoyl-CoA hydratase n=1 Tax=Novosphingobium aquimarinum TaxID=2682494 RepID=UPI0012EC09FF|nr:enoyl-CoA hydratase [Novosphingobium aquimarinum]